MKSVEGSELLAAAKMAFRPNSLVAEVGVGCMCTALVPVCWCNPTMLG